MPAPAEDVHKIAAMCHRDEKEFKKMCCGIQKIAQSSVSVQRMLREKDDKQTVQAAARESRGLIDSA